jgi:hypothetical protein
MALLQIYFFELCLAVLYSNTLSVTLADHPEFLSTRRVGTMKRSGNSSAMDTFGIDTSQSNIEPSEESDLASFKDRDQGTIEDEGATSEGESDEEDIDGEIKSDTVADTSVESMSDEEDSEAHSGTTDDDSETAAKDNTEAAIEGEQEESQMQDEEEDEGSPSFIQERERTGKARVLAELRKMHVSQDVRADKGKLLFVGYLSAPDNFERRATVRQKCFPSIKAAGYDVKFFIGRPNEIGPPIENGQGQRATDYEAEMATKLQDESDKNGDIVITPFRDAYRDLTDKVAFLFRYALQENAQNVLKIDDDMCPDMSVVVKVSKTTTPSQARYIGQYLWNGDEYEIMKGPDGTKSKFMTGVGFILSAKLARTIFYDDLVHTLLFAPYGTSSDDANVGKWYDYAVRKHPKVKFSEEVFEGLATPIEQPAVPAVPDNSDDNSDNSGEQAVAQAVSSD